MAPPLVQSVAFDYRSAAKQDEVFGTWKGQIDELARCPNVVAKLGGLNMEVNGYGWENRP